MSNNITKTIKESLAKIDEMVENYDRYEVNEFESHLLQSQIKVIEVQIAEMESIKYNLDISNDPDARFLASYQLEVGYNMALDHQISSLNETLEELTKSL